MLGVDPVAVIAIVLLCASLGWLAWLLLGGAASERRRAVLNLRRGLKQADVQGRPELRNNPGLLEVIGRQSPPILTRTVNKLLLGAGRPPRWPMERVLAAKYLLGLAGVLLGFLFFRANPTPGGLLLGVAVTAFFFFIPDLRLYSMGIERRQAIALQLPDTLDQMSIAVEAGLGFDAAMVHVARNGKGELADELVRTLQDIQVGQTRRAAYEDLATRTGVPTLRRFTRSIIQAETYGIALADVLQSQADEMRIERRQLAEQKAMKIPVKVVFPLVLFILPVMFIVILGPAVLSIMEVFGGR